ncbi:MAG: MCE family protein [Actinomycetales bacterium]|nr:MAG: MCE family protein [Actinomycetales bacterium]
MMPISAPHPRLVVLVVASLLLVAGILVATRDTERTVNAVFPRTVGLYEGSDVRIMGVNVGEVRSISPRGTSVLVSMTYDARYTLPADAKAVIVAPSVIADRFVQLTPSYRGGAALPDHATLGVRSTGVPIELDQTFDATNRFLGALGPDGANRDGALSRLLGVGADLLEGQGAPLRGALRDVADATETFADGSADASRTVQNLSEVTGTLADYDDDVRSFTEELATVSSTLADDSADISTLLRTLATGLGEVESFVRDNRVTLARDVAGLRDVADTLVSEKAALAEVVDLLPLGFTNLVETYDAPAGSVRTRANFTEIARAIDKVVCAAVEKSAGDGAKPVCDVLTRLIDGLPIIRDGLDLPGGS